MQRREDAIARLGDILSDPAKGQELTDRRQAAVDRLAALGIDDPVLAVRPPLGAVAVPNLDGEARAWRCRGARTARTGDSLFVTMSVGVFDGLLWKHCAASYPDHLPTYGDMRMIRRNWFDAGDTAIQVFPPESEYVNLHPNCLHLWACVEGRGVPDFRVLGMI